MFPEEGKMWSDLSSEEMVEVWTRPMWYSLYVPNRDARKKPERVVKPLLGQPTITFNLSLYESQQNPLNDVAYKDTGKQVFTMNDLLASKSALRLINKGLFSEEEYDMYGSQLDHYLPAIVKELLRAGRLDTKPLRGVTVDAYDLVEDGYKIEVSSPEIKIIDPKRPSRKNTLGYGYDTIRVFNDEQDAKAYYVNKATSSLVNQIEEYEARIADAKKKIEEIVKELDK